MLNGCPSLSLELPTCRVLYWIKLQSPHIWDVGISLERQFWFHIGDSFLCVYLSLLIPHWAPWLRLSGFVPTILLKGLSSRTFPRTSWWENPMVVSKSTGCCRGSFLTTLYASASAALTGPCPAPAPGSRSACGALSIAPAPPPHAAVSAPVPSSLSCALSVDWTQLSCIASRFFTLWATRKAPFYWYLAYV